MSEWRKITSRAEQLEEAFARGELPEQNGLPPRLCWCSKCKGRGHNDAGYKCDLCAGRGVIHAGNMVSAPDLGPLFDRRSAATEKTLQDRFLAFHARNPQVYATLVAQARRWRAEGREAMGVGFFWERMRWLLIRRTDALDVKLNNDYRSRYARLVMQREPDLAGVFETRKLRAQ